MSLSTLTVFLSFFTLTDGSAFLKPAPLEVTAAEVQSVMSELLSQLTHSDKISSIEHEMRPMYMALPKNMYGTLEYSTVRYAVHRYFVQKYGWHMKGLEATDAAATPSSANILKERTPSYVQSLFQQRMHGAGFGLREIAGFAAVLSDLVNKEALNGLLDVFSALHLPGDNALQPFQVNIAIRSWFLHYVRAASGRHTDNTSLATMESDMPDMYPGWADTSVWAQDFRLTYNHAKVAKRNPFVHHVDTFDDVVEYVQELGHGFGSYQRTECNSLKRQLTDMEFEGTGRVLLSRFYQGGLKGDWTFTEPVEYLRNLGVVDESDPKRPSVMIPNYLSSAANCLISTGFYKVCCSDECEGLVQKLEQALAAPKVSPTRITQVVSNLPSDTVDAPRNISDHMVKLLDQIADRHGGSVPLHGRLFAQWMHHAYPRECPFPHVTGVIKPMSPLEWMERTGNSTEATLADMKFYHSRLQADEATSLELPWDFDEELVAEQYTSPISSLSYSALGRAAMGLLVLASFGKTLIRVFTTASSDEKVGKEFSVLV